MPDPKESFADWLDSQKCAEILREERWPDGIIRCPFCNSDNVFTLGKYKEVFFRYQCRDCTEKRRPLTTKPQPYMKTQSYRSQNGFMPKYCCETR